MKKFVSVILTISLSLSAAMPAFAANTPAKRDAASAEATTEIASETEVSTETTTAAEDSTETVTEASTETTTETTTEAETVTSPFSDVEADTPQGEAIIKMYKSGCLAGYKDGTFRPDGQVTRAELVRIINQVFGFTLNEKLNTTDFSDNANTEAWYYNDVRIAQQMGYISGFGDNSFRPADNFTRQQACVVLTLLTNAPEADKEISIADEVSPWAEKYVKAAINSRLFSLEAGNTFRAVENITRGELCVALAGYVKDTAAPAGKSTEETTTEATTETGTEATTKRSSSGGGGGGSSSSKSSSSSSSDSTGSSSTTASTTTESTTEATTASSKTTTKTTTTTTTTTTAATTTTEAATEITTAEVKVDADLLNSVRRTARNIDRYVIPNCSTDAQKEVAGDISAAMAAFMSDNSYDVESAANEAMDKYHSLSSAEKDEFKKLIIGYCAMSDLVKLRDTFFPGLTY